MNNDDLWRYSQMMNQHQNQRQAYGLGGSVTGLQPQMQNAKAVEKKPDEQILLLIEEGE